jgi:predicted nucleotidyltransferase
MLNLYTISTKKEQSQESFTSGEKTSLLYHDLFDYPLSFSDLIKWQSGKQPQTINRETTIISKRGFYFLEGREGLIYKRILRKRISAKKMKIAKAASKVLSFVPGVRMVGVTGSLAMENSAEESDLDLMIITKKGMLWTTRMFAYMVIHAFGFSARKPNDLRQKDKLCLNMWLDESDLVWHERNLYTAHEIAQIVPIVNKNQTYERFLIKNKWIRDFWPNAVRVKNFTAKRVTQLKIKNSTSTTSLLENIAYRFQYSYMKNRISREVVTPTRAIFHPQDWGKVVLSRLSS